MTLRILMALLCLATPLQAQNEIPKRVMNFVPRVVRVTATGANGEFSGFGILVGETSQYGYVVTARHILTDAGDAPEVLVKPRRKNVPWKSEIINQSEALDIVALKIGPSSEPASLKGCLHPVPKSYLNTAVWLIGREGEWYVSTLPGRVNVDEPNQSSRFSFDMVGVRPGSSGAPLLGDQGLLGMVLTDTGLNEARAVDIRAIRQQFLAWKIPWNLGDCRLFESKTAEGTVDTGLCEGPSGLFGVKSDCNENSAKRVDVCTTVPDDGRIGTIRLFRRWTGGTEWSEFKSGDNCEWCKFVGNAKVADAGGQKQVCWEFLQWSSHQSRTARILVNYQVPADE